MTKKKLLILGGTGFLGYHLAVKAIKKKWIVHSISQKKPPKKRFCKGVKYIFCDISHKRKIFNSIKINYDFVVNFGGYVDHKNFKKTYSSHFKGCQNVINTLQKKNLVPYKFIQIGSSIENGKYKSPQTELYPNKNIKINSVYGNSKYEATKYLIYFYNKFNFPVVILRPYIIFGPRQDPNRFIPFVIKNCIENKKFKLSSCEQFRDFLYVEDFTKSIFKIFKTNSDTNGNIFNIGSGKPIKLMEVVNYICEKIQRGKPIYGKIKLRADEIKKMYPKINKIKKIIGWESNTSFKRGLNKTIKEMQNE